jgi:hypothetical protein
VKGIRDDRVSREARAEAMDVFLEDNMDGGNDAAGLRIADTIATGVGWLANHDAPERFFAKFTTQLVGHLGKDGAAEYVKFGGVRRGRRKESEVDTAGEAHGAIVGTVA